jgi:hypothetical protein
MQIFFKKNEKEVKKSDFCISALHIELALAGDTPEALSWRL